MKKRHNTQLSLIASDHSNKLYILWYSFVVQLLCINIKYTIYANAIYWNWTIMTSVVYWPGKNDNNNFNVFIQFINCLQSKLSVEWKPVSLIFISLCLMLLSKQMNTFMRIVSWLACRIFKSLVGGITMCENELAIVWGNLVLHNCNLLAVDWSVWSSNFGYM